MFCKEFHQLRVISILVIESLLFSSTRPFFSFLVSSTSQITQIVISNSINTAHRTQNTSTSCTRFFNRTTSFRVFLAISFASAHALIFVVSTISTADRMRVSWACITTLGVLALFVFAFAKSYEFLLIALQFTKVSVSDSISTTSWQEQFGTEFTTSQNGWAFSIALFHDTNTFHGAFVVVSQSINTTNWSVNFWTVTWSKARSFGLWDLLGAAQDTKVFIGVSCKRADWLEFFSSTVTSQRRVVWLPVVIVARSIISEFGVIAFKSAFVKICDTVSAADWEVGLRAVRL